MEPEFALALVMRWIHLLCAVAVGGSILFHWIVLTPAAKKALTPEQHAALRDPLMRRWKMIIHPSIVLFLISGFYNYIKVTAPQHQEQPLYHALFGVKFLLAIVLFAMAIVLTSTRKWSEKWRESKFGWFILAATVVAIVLIGGYMKRMGPSWLVEEPANAAPTSENA